ncbi:MAG TPA: hypothetical protein VM143_13000 [Acidimicrobiales bacterium]|nr:hypothetical protein [Acidimicrobiales bacterium]
MRRRSARIGAVAALATVALAVGACGDGSSKSDDPVEAAQDSLANVKRVTIELRLTATAGSADDRTGDVGFALTGPLQLPEGDGDLPIADLRSTRMFGRAKGEVETQFVSTGSRAWVSNGSELVELKGKQLDGLRGTTKGGADLEALHLSRWFATRKVTERGGTTTVTGTLDAPSAINDVVTLAGSSGGDAGGARLQGKDAEQLRSLVRSSSVELVSSADGGLQRLHFDVHFAPDEASKSAVARLLPSLAGVDLTFDLRLRNVGRKVTVRPPSGA